MQKQDNLLNDYFETTRASLNAKHRDKQMGPATVNLSKNKSSKKDNEISNP